MKSPDAPVKIDDLLFEEQDLAIFRIPDFQTRVATIEGYFFPRFNLLLNSTLDLIREAFGQNDFARVTVWKGPQPRVYAKKGQFNPGANFRISGKRSKSALDLGLAGDKKSFLHPTWLGMNITEDGSINAQLDLLRFRVALSFASKLSDALLKEQDRLQAMLSINHVSYFAATALVSFSDALDPEVLLNNRTNNVFFSPDYFFPVTALRGIRQVQHAFVAMYPILDTSIRIAEEQKSILTELLDKYEVWFDYDKRFWEVDAAHQQEADESGLSLSFDSYHYIRSHRWWQVLARDSWICKSCGRSPKADGVTLHVDHILPRSKGGTDGLDNLQTLCAKCNLGKSNRDSTDLR
jgi:HNH endonuclease